MDNETLEQLKKETQKDDAMIGRTLRLPQDIDFEINEFCDENNIRRSVLYRRIFEEGWKVLKP